MSQNKTPPDTFPTLYLIHSSPKVTELLKETWKGVCFPVNFAAEVNDNLYLGFVTVHLNEWFSNLYLVTQHCIL